MHNILIEFWLYSFVVFVLHTGKTIGTPPEQEKVELQLSRIKRDDNSDGESYHLKFQAFGTDYDDLLVKPRRSIFSPNFQYLLMDDEINKQQKVREATPTPEELREIEGSHFVNSLSLGAFSLREVDGVRKIRGTMGDISINSIEKSSPMVKRQNTKVNSKHIITDFLHKTPVLVSKNGKHISEPNNDYIDIHRKIAPASQERKLFSGGPASANPEVLIVLDHKKYEDFNGVSEDILDYMGVYFHAINNLYAGIADPKITFSIVGIALMTTTKAQPFIENGKSPSGTVYDLPKILDNFGYWVYANRATLPKHDLAALITGIDAHSLKNGVYEPHISGIAYLGAACYVSHRKSKSLTVSVSEDKGRYFAGSYTTAHELAHNLGAPHDGEGKAMDCSWKDGHIMSYEGWGTSNKYLFSKCSAKIMKELIFSTSAKCLNTIQNGDRVAISTDLPGYIINMDTHCKHKTKNPTAVANTQGRTPSETCKRLICTYTKPGQPNTKWTWNIGQALEGSRCGTGGRCMKGECH